LSLEGGVKPCCNNFIADNASSMPWNNDLLGIFFLPRCDAKSKGWCAHTTPLELRRPCARPSRLRGYPDPMRRTHTSRSRYHVLAKQVPEHAPLHRPRDGCRHSHSASAPLTSTPYMVSRPTQDGITGFMLAVEKGHVEVAQLLLDRGAIVDEVTQVRQPKMHTRMHARTQTRTCTYCVLPARTQPPSFILHFVIPRLLTSLLVERPTSRITLEHAQAET
jgi:hypothetical protein